MVCSVAFGERWPVSGDLRTASLRRPPHSVIASMLRRRVELHLRATHMTVGTWGGAVVERAVRDVADARPEVTIAERREVSRRSGRRLTFLPPSPAPRARGGSRTILRVLSRLWIPLVLLVVICTGGFTVARLHGAFGSEKRLSYADTGKDDAKPFNPKHLTYEVFGPPGTVADISYFDDNGDPQFIHRVPLPWSLEFAVTGATGAGNVASQGDSDSIGCRILIDGVVKAEKITHDVHAFTFCMLKAA
jgi:Mycobacterium membrane protein